MGGGTSRWQRVRWFFTRQAGRRSAFPPGCQFCDFLRGTGPGQGSLVKIADEIRKASRIRTHGMLNPSEPASKEPASKEKEKTREVPEKNSASDLRLTSSPFEQSCSADINPRHCCL